MHSNVIVSEKIMIQDLQFKCPESMNKMIKKLETNILKIRL